MPELEAGDWLYAVDPEWRPAAEDARPPLAALLGAWPVGGGPFRANPHYAPSGEDSPTDPVDAAVRLAARGEYSAAAVVSTMREAVLGIALDDTGEAVVTRSPDGVPSVLVATAPAHTRWLEVPVWQEITAAALAESLPERGVDVLLNPGAPASMRVVAESLREVAADAGPLPDSPFPEAAR